MDNDNTIKDASQFVDEMPEEKAIIKVIGVGGGGGNAVNYLYRQGIENITFMVCNTDMKALRNLDVPRKIVMGDPDSKDFGLGAGDDPVKGREAAEFSAEDIRAVLQDDTNMVFITAGMGGGTGTGAAPVVAQIARDAGLLTVGIVTIPFMFEGEQKILKALQGAEEMRGHVDSLLIVNNERLTEIYKDLNLVNAFSKADDTLANATSSIARMIYSDGYINADFRDVRTTLQNSSTSIISTGYGEGEHRVTKAIKDALNSPLLRNSDIKSSKRLLFYLYCNPNAENVVSMEEMNEITQFSNDLNRNIGIKWGVCWDDTLGEGVKMTILASGFDVSITDKNKKRKKEDEVITFSASGSKQAGEPSAEKDDREKTKQIIEDLYGQGKMTEHAQDIARKKYVVLKPSQFDNDEFITLFEKTPAYSRNSDLAEAMRAIGTPQASATASGAAHKSNSSAAESETPHRGNTITF